MSEFSDLLLSFMPPAEALLFLGLAGVDVLQTKYMEKSLSGVDDRVKRLEDQFIASDGGQDE